MNYIDFIFLSRLNVSVSGKFSLCKNVNWWPSIENINEHTPVSLIFPWVKYISRLWFKYNATSLHCSNSKKGPHNPSTNSVTLYLIHSLFLLSLFYFFQKYSEKKSIAHELKDFSIIPPSWFIIMFKSFRRKISLCTARIFESASLEFRKSYSIRFCIVFSRSLSI